MFQLTTNIFVYIDKQKDCVLLTKKICVMLILQHFLKVIITFISHFVTSHLSC